MNREPIHGECVIVTRNSGDHGGAVGHRFIVCAVDESDCTIKGIPRGSSTAADFWIPWCDIEPVTFGWGYAHDHLPAELLPLLTACDGIEYLSLNPSIKDEIFHSLPDWRERLLEAISTMELENL